MDLKVSVTRLFIEEASESEKKEALKNQNSLCKTCGIDIKKYAKYEQVSNKDGKIEVFALCSVCHSSQHIEELPPESSGKMVMLSEISQVEVIALSRMIALIKKLDADAYDGDIESAAMVYMLMEANKEQSEIYFATGASDVELVAQMLSNQDDDFYERREEGLFNLRWLPDYTYFEKEINYWFETLMKDTKGQYHPDGWESLKNKLDK